jgi:hypothetical protein
MPKAKSRDERYLESRLASAIDAVFWRFRGKLADDLGKRLRAELMREIKRSFRFSGLRGRGKTAPEVLAARDVLIEHGGPMWGEELMAELRAGGISREPTGARGSSIETEIRRSLGSAASRHGTNIKLLKGKGERDFSKKLFGLPGRD